MLWIGRKNMKNYWQFRKVSKRTGLRETGINHVVRIRKRTKFSSVGNVERKVISPRTVESEQEPGYNLFNCSGKGHYACKKPWNQSLFNTNKRRFQQTQKKSGKQEVFTLEEVQKLLRKQQNSKTQNVTFDPIQNALNGRRKRSAQRF